MTIDFGQVVVVNESRDPDQAGDVTLFKNIADAESYIEPIDVKNEEYCAYMIDGRQLNLSVVKSKGIFAIEKIRIEPDLSAQDHSDRIRSLLEATGAAVQAARKRRKGIEPGLKPSAMSIGELIELIGFSR